MISCEKNMYEFMYHIIFMFGSIMIFETVLKILGYLNC